MNFLSSPDSMLFYLTSRNNSVLFLPSCWWSGVVVSVLASINKVNLSGRVSDEMGDHVLVQFPVPDTKVC